MVLGDEAEHPPGNLYLFLSSEQVPFESPNHQTTTSITGVRDGP